MKMSEEEKEEMTDWLIAREECVEEDKKYIVKLTNEEYKRVIDVAQEDIKKQFKQKVKDKINKYIDQKLVELTKTGSYTQNEGTPEQERLNGMQRGAKDIKKILLEDK